MPAIAILQRLPLPDVGHNVQLLFLSIGPSLTCYVDDERHADFVLPCLARGVAVSRALRISWPRM